MENSMQRVYEEKKLTHREPLTKQCKKMKKENWKRSEGRKVIGNDGYT